MQALAFFVLSTLALGARAQSLSNGGFETPYVPLGASSSCPTITGEVAGGWFDNSCWSGNLQAQIAYSRSTLTPHGGASAQRVAVGGGVMQLAQSLDLPAGRRFNASIWMRASTPMQVEFLLRRADPPYSTFVNRSCVLTPSWTRYEFEGFAQAGPAFLMVRTDDVGAFELDDASLTSVAAAPTLATGPIAPEFFGLHLHASDRPWPHASLEVECVRIWDSDGPVGGSGGGAQWASVQPAPGVFDWSALDQHVARAAQRGAQVHYVLGRTPQWASARPLEFSPYGPGQAAEPADLQHWRDWVQAVAQRYRGVIRVWEIWNEPNDASFFTGDVATLVTLAAQARAILLAVDPANIVVGPSPYDLGYLERFLESGGAATCDVVGYHFYLFEEAPEFLFSSYLPNARLILERYGAGAKPLWNTEAGWALQTPETFEVQVGWMARACLLNWAGGAERYYHYSWDPGAPAGVELATPPAFDVLGPAGVAYAEVGRWMRGASMGALAELAGGTWSIEFTRSGGERAFAVWNPAASAAQPASFAPPAAWNVAWVRELDGSVAPYGGGALSLDARPRLLEQHTRIESRDCACAAAAPCSNPSADSGCRNSRGLGARLLAQGSSSVARDDLVLTAVELPAGRSTLLFMGGGALVAPLGAGLRCVGAAPGGGLARWPLRISDAAGSASWGPALVASSQTGLNAIDAGELWRFQAWYRDASNACAQTTNLSDALALTFY